MINNRLPRRSGERTIIKKMEPVLLTIASLLIGILLAELFCRLFLPSIAATEARFSGMRRIVFFDGSSTIFQNHGNIFTYVPHDDIRNLTVFFYDHDYTVEYDYHFRTNNFGLVQDADVVTNQDSLLILGDLFTEGQGAEPWFRLVSPEVGMLGYQAVNGGLRGTGFGQWLELERYLAAKKVRIKKLVVVFISDDYHRLVSNFDPQEMQCISALSLCRVEQSYIYRLPPQEELVSWIAKIRMTRAPFITRSWLGSNAARLLPVSYYIVDYFRSRFKNATVFDRAEEQSRAAIAEMIRIYGVDNVAFIHLPQKDESDGPNQLGLRARHSIQEAGGKLFDGFKLCRLTATDYYSNDNHPNISGYAKIASCVKAVMHEAMARAQ